MARKSQPGSLQQEKDLFDQSGRPEPLAARMRPQKLEELFGQEEIVGEGRLLRRAIQADRITSLIFYGPPGTGKTTLARIIANTTKSRFISLNAVLCGVKEIRLSIEEAKDIQRLYDQRTILFIDEVHRWNKSQQDALLPWVENGTIILIGATTENPYFEVNAALVSRSRIFQLTSLSDVDLMNIVKYALQEKGRGYGKWDVQFEAGALEHLVKASSGDARTLLNAVELAVETTPDDFPPPEGTEILIPLAVAEESIQRRALLYDKEGDYHFDTISAFIKSIRGSDPDAVLYWLSLMVQGGEDPRFILRRLLISASEDIGLADPNALVVVGAAATAFDRVGLPEGLFHLTQAALYLATAPKSNSTLAVFDAMREVEKGMLREVPDPMKDASRDKKGFGHGVGYKYPHAFRDHWIEQQYLPEGLSGKVFYQPSGQGYEKKVQEEVLRRRELQLAALFEERTLAFYQTRGKSKGPSGPGSSAGSISQRNEWERRTLGSSEHFLGKLREEVFTRLISHCRISLGASDSRSSFIEDQNLVIAEDKTGIFFFEAFRQFPKGIILGAIARKENFEIVDYLLQSLPENERPSPINKDYSDCSFLKIVEKEVGHQFCFLGMNLFRESGAEKLNRGLNQLKPAKTFLVEVLRGEGSNLSCFLPEGEGKEALVEAEDKIFESFREADKDLIDCKGENLPFKEFQVDRVEILESRILTEAFVDRWICPSDGRENPGCMMKESLGDDFDSLYRDIKMELIGREVLWNKVVLFLSK